MDMKESYTQMTSIYAQFARPLEEYKWSLNGSSNSKPLDSDCDYPKQLEIIKKFIKIITWQSSQASSFGNDWDLEAKLWRLVDDLYYFNVCECDEELIGMNKEIEELSIILQWLRMNSKVDSDSYLDDCEEDNSMYSSKWEKTRSFAERSRLGRLLARRGNENENENEKDAVDDDLVNEIDIDAPLRNKKKIDKEDLKVDERNFEAIYKRILLGDYDLAIATANETGNHELAIILTGATDKGSKFDRALWTKLVYKLSNNSQLQYYERLIYTYLSGGDISENLKLASNSYDYYMNILVHQLLCCKLTKTSKSNAFSEITLPRPQAQSMKDILNVVANSSGTGASEQSRHPLRIIAGSVMIEELNSIISTLNESTDDNILRIVTHLAIISALLKPIENPMQFSSLITLYVSKLAENNESDLIPLYLSFIPDEKDARETYSLILSKITDKDERVKQLEIAKRIAQPAVVDDEDLIAVDDVERDKLVNVLRRTVERVMNETEPYYKQENGPITLFDDESAKIDDVDFKLCSAVEWFYENLMFEDAISATLVVLRRFLMVGKLQSLKKFAQGKNFKNLISEYNLKSLGKKEGDIEISEDQKSELLSYQNLIEGLELISDWKKFNLEIGGNPYKGPNVEASLRKTTQVLNNLLSNWLIDLQRIDPLLKEFRAMYVPYIIIELISIYQNARVSDWKYVKMAYDLINSVADESANDFLHCFTVTGRLQEFLAKVGELAIVACEKGIDGLYCL